MQILPDQLAATRQDPRIRGPAEPASHLPGAACAYRLAHLAGAGNPGKNVACAALPQLSRICRRNPHVTVTKSVVTLSDSELACCLLPFASVLSLCDPPCPAL